MPTTFILFDFDRLPFDLVDDIHDTFGDTAIGIVVDGAGNVLIIG